MGETFEVGEQRARNVHVHQGVSEDEFVKMRTARNAVLAAPLLLLPSIQGEHPRRQVSAGGSERRACVYRKP
jgi:hypothetical protein